MTLESTARLALPLLQPGQAQKEMFHNEALTRIDLCLQGAIIANGENHPPADPQPGEAWIIGDTPDGDWAGRALQIAGWTTGGWRYVAPLAGMTLWFPAQKCFVQYDGHTWREGEVAARQLVIDGEKVVGTRQGAIADPSGGAVVDVEAREVIGAVLEALRQHGLVASG